MPGITTPAWHLASLSVCEGQARFPPLLTPGFARRLCSGMSSSPLGHCSLASRRHGGGGATGVPAWRWWGLARVLSSRGAYSLQLHVLNLTFIFPYLKIGKKNGSHNEKTVFPSQCSSGEFTQTFGLSERHGLRVVHACTARTVRLITNHEKWGGHSVAIRSGFGPTCCERWHSCDYYWLKTGTHSRLRTELAGHPQPWLYCGPR